MHAHRHMESMAISRDVAYLRSSWPTFPGTNPRECLDDIRRRNSPVATSRPRWQAGSLPQNRVRAQHVLPDRYGLDRPKQDPRCPEVIGVHAQIDDLAYGGIAHQIIRH